jgi:hypothetical protein
MSTDVVADTNSIELTLGHSWVIPGSGIGQQMKGGH